MKDMAAIFVAKGQGLIAVKTPSQAAVEKLIQSILATFTV